ncbi:MAG: type II toxin-antitoxin system mRNA interferase toxin, RelE/StbE family [Patescibacteria group bacterium]
MKADFHKSFNKQFQKLPVKQKFQVRQAINIFVNEPNHLSLRNHTLKGRWTGHRSISAGGDLRLHYVPQHDDRAVFVAVGKHAQLYG